jgi:potassium-dependent mechanosensitive channel
VKSKSIPFFLCLLTLSLPCAGQLEKFLNKPATAEAPVAKLDIRSELNKWKEESKNELQRIAELESFEQLPDEINAADLSASKRYLDRILIAITRHIAILDDAKQAQAALLAAREKAKAWKGYDTPAPYSVLMLDELSEQKQALENKQASSRSSIAVFEANLAELLKESKQVTDEVESQQTSSKNDSKKLKQRYLFIRASALQHEIAALEETLKADEVGVELLDKKISDIGDNVVLSYEDLERVIAASKDRQAGLKKESSELRKKLPKAQEEKDSSIAALDKQKATNPQDPANLQLAEFRAETATLFYDSLQAMTEILDSFLQIEALIPDAYQQRYTLLSRSTKSSEQNAALDNLNIFKKRILAWQLVFQNELSSISADIGKIQSRTSLLPADDAKLVPLNAQLKILWEKQVLTQRVHQSLTNQSGALERWLSKYDQAWHKPIQKALNHTWLGTKRLWDIPVNRYQESIEIDGKKVEVNRFVSLGNIITAVLIFAVAYMIAARICSKLQLAIVQRKILGEAQARTLGTWLMLFVAILLALATLSWLSIPLTIFAFLAGALAIGIGFGTQTIIKNFISGIILLFERKIRVGDVIEVAGTQGVVSEINTRSSIVKGPNGIENLIPNSLFLENRVANWTLNSRLFRRELTINAAHGSPSQLIIETINDAAERHGLILKDPAPFATLSQIGENSLGFTLHFWIQLSDKTNGLVVDSDLRIMVEKQLGEQGIQIGAKANP